MGSAKEFYLGKIFDLKKGALTDELLSYDPPDLTTHAIVTGMTGSGKTGLCVGLLEEAALQGIPAILIDPKGDLTNLLLTFPDLKAADFEPWLDATYIRRENKTIAQAAEETAATWKKGLAEWGLDGKHIQQLKDAVARTIYTPGSSSGIPVNILASFEAPDMPWEENEEVLREKIAATVTALLTLVGIKDIDPLRSREHILLSNIVEYHWRKGASLDLQGLILETQDPPLEKLGAFSLNDFFPKKERSELAMLLNNFLASPTFQDWIEGQPLDIQAMLYTPAGKARHSIFYLAHLSDSERMFFVTLLYSAVETWMRKQSGTSDLRALVYFDEIHGYLPPIANPPSKPLIIRLLKTARAFGVGLVLTTQNPVDIDYKGISNAGTWMIGRLQTDQDKQRLLDGLESASGGVPRAEYDKLISALGKRVFLYHNVHEKKPAIFQTRFAMSYLAGPLTAGQIPALNALAGAQPAAAGKSAAKIGVQPATPKTEGAAAKPGVSGVREYFLSANAGASLNPALLAIAEVRYFSRTPNVNVSHRVSVLVDDPRETGQSWENYIAEIADASIRDTAPAGAKFANLPDFMGKSAWWSGQEKEFEQWVFESDTVTVRVSKALGISAGPEVSDEQFRRQVQSAAQAKAEAESKKLEISYRSKEAALKTKIERQQTKVDKYQSELTSRGLDTALKVGESLFKLATKRRLTGVSSSATKVRMASDAKGRLDEAKAVLEGYQDELAALQQSLADEKQALLDKWLAEGENYDEINLTPTKQNIRITHFGIGWKG
ncbi:MAG: type IV secretion system DNA-binding domain-containing protein [Anaerolineae bacterium]|nr:type IV secretion system DNA-binding domain-containing protein [Anaerolineae bacterium]